MVGQRVPWYLSLLFFTSRGYSLELSLVIIQRITVIGWCHSDQFGNVSASQSVKKIIEINPYMLGTMAGGAADCQFWHRNLGIKVIFIVIIKLFQWYNKEMFDYSSGIQCLESFSCTQWCLSLVSNFIEM